MNVMNDDCYPHVEKRKGQGCDALTAGKCNLAQLGSFLERRFTQMDKGSSNWEYESLKLFRIPQTDNLILISGDYGGTNGHQCRS